MRSLYIWHNADAHLPSRNALSSNSSRAVILLNARNFKSSHSNRYQTESQLPGFIVAVASTDHRLVWHTQNYRFYMSRHATNQTPHFAVYTTHDSPARRTSYYIGLLVPLYLPLASFRSCNHDVWTWGRKILVSDGIHCGASKEITEKGFVLAGI